MDSNTVWWFVGGLVGGVVGAAIGRAVYNFVWTYYEDLQKLNLRIVDVQRGLGEDIRQNELRRSDNFHFLYNKIQDLTCRITALEPKKTK